MLTATGSPTTSVFAFTPRSRSETGKATPMPRPPSTSDCRPPHHRFSSRLCSAPPRRLRRCARPESSRPRSPCSAGHAGRRHRPGRSWQSAYTRSRVSRRSRDLPRSLGLFALRSGPAPGSGLPIKRLSSLHLRPTHNIAIYFSACYDSASCRTFQQDRGSDNRFAFRCLNPRQRPANL